jgi:outer membrane protein assembly factor BamE (lipoprotein component of BamABCDE complex)
MKGNNGVRMLMLCAAGALALALSGCGKNCRETVRMADFEMSQGNYVRAEALYEEALKMDSEVCADAEQKLVNLRILMED